jgi:hypothetical protein
MRQLFFIVFSTLFFGCGGCGSETPPIEPQAPREYNNVTILLDFSNRVLNENQAQKDKQIINLILSLFKDRQKLKFRYRSIERLKVAIAYQQNANNNMFDLGDKLSIDMRGKTAPKFREIQALFSTSVDELYQNTNSKSSMTGADIWTFFRDNTNVFQMASNEKMLIKNKVIILTDGYLQFDKSIYNKRSTGTQMRYDDMRKLRKSSNWESRYKTKNYALTPHDKSLYDNLSVLMLEVDPKNPAQSTNEFQIVKHYWKDWFSKMEIPCEVLKTVDNVSNIEGEIKRFLEE